MKKIGLLMLALVFAIGVLGVGYAMWSEELTIDTTVNTGDLDVDLACKDVVLVQDKVVGTGTCSTTADPNILEVVIGNAYPCLSGDIMFDIDNVGTIPAHVIEVWFHAKADGKYGTEIDEDGAFIGDTTPFVASNRIELVECEWLFFDLDNDCDADLSLHLKDGLICTQIDPPGMGLPGPDFVEGKINFHVEQGAEEEATYWFNIEIVACQWNEAP